MAERESPTLVRGITTATFFARFLFDPLEAIQQIYRRFGEFVVFEPPPIVPAKYKRTCIIAVGSRFNQQVLADPLTWRTFGIGPGGDKKSASRRLARGLISAQGNEHKHYRQLLHPPLRPKSVDAYSAQLQRVVVDEVETWPLNETINLWAYVQNLIQTIAISLLFGGDQVRGQPVAKLTHRWFDNVWSMKVILCPVNIPGTPYSRMLRDGEALERRILDWAACKRGDLVGKDLLAILVNNPDETGQPASDVKIAGHMPTLLAAAFETCQNALIWTLVLLAQHPRIARDLLDEVKGRLAGAAPSLDALSDLPLIAAVIKESMRLLPPVPQQFRIAYKATTIANFPVSAKTRVLLSPFLTNRDPDLYPDSDRFKPERWADIDPMPHEYLAFSGGPRSCPGYWFGFAILKVAIAAILTRCRVALAPGAHINYKVNLALTPSGEIPATLHYQDGAFAASPIQGNIRKLVRLHD